VAVDAEGSSDLKAAELDRHREMISRFLAGAGVKTKRRSSITMILRSPESPAAIAMLGMKEALQRAAIGVRVVLAKVEPEDALRQLHACLGELAPNRPVHEVLRWARNPRLLDAHEQVTFGEAMCWTGDAMRRDCDRRNALTLLSEAAPEAIRLSKLAFEALWSASMPVPKAHLDGRTSPTGVYQPSAEASMALSTIRRNFQGWPLIRH
jgi:hypothetical protein